jgi:hypothetical protein
VKDAETLVSGLGGGLGFEVQEEGAEGVRGGNGLVLGVVFRVDPLAELAGTDGEVFETGGIPGAHVDAGLSEAVGEGCAPAGDGDEGVKG